MSLKNRLSTFDPTLRFSVHVPSKSKVEKMARQISQQTDMPIADVKVPEALIKETMTSLESGQIGSAPSRNLRLFCVAGLSALKSAQEPLHCVKTLLAEVNSRARKSIYRALIGGYLHIADLKFDWVDSIRRFLVKHINELPPRWVERCQHFDLLDKEPCQMLAQSFWALETDFESQLEEAGISGALTTTGIGNRLLESLCDLLSQSDWLNDDNAPLLLSRFFHYISPNEKLIFTGSSCQIFIVKALLTPCIERTISPDLERQIQHFLLMAYSDPRVNPGKWGKIPPELISVLTRWLTKQAMGLLIEVLNKTADDNHWDSRNDFWGYYLDNDLVDEAWVVFGPDAYRHAQELVRSSQDFSTGTFAMLQKGGGQFQPNHSVLLMRIDNVIIAEWTHNGRVRLWESTAFGCPRFYRQQYTAGVLRGSAIRNAPSEEHTHDIYGHWKDKVAAFIENHTGIKHEHLGPRSRSRRPEVDHVKTIHQSTVVSSNTSTRTSEKEKPLSSAYNGLPSAGICKGCGKTKPASEFYISKRREGELTKFCKQCSASNY